MKTATSDMQPHIDEHLSVVHALRGRVASLEAMADLIVRTFRAGGRLLLIGNAGR
ncbi:MAG TPA: hypothetical protein VGM03_01915 [Phycisphaerae bacterium]|jgi:phosphoheptose isomerase